MKNLSIIIGVMTLLIIYYTLGTAPLFCTAGGLMVGSIVERVGWN